MHSLGKPEIDFLELFHQCIVKNKILDENLKNKFSLIDSAAKEYESKAKNRELYKINPVAKEELNPVTPDDLRKLYRLKLSKKGSPMRASYDKILAGAKKYLCCFCSYGEPSELDHYLPQSRFPEFSILPINLIPICSYCNRLKLDEAPKSFIESYVHPYYEEYSEIQWLVADLQFENNIPIVTFHINNELRVSNPNLFTRLEFQFTRLGLNKRYSTRANAVITDIHDRLNKLRISSGSDEVRKHLIEEAKNRLETNKNSWDSVLYNCLCKNIQFYEVSWSV